MLARNELCVNTVEKGKTFYAIHKNLVDFVYDLENETENFRKTVIRNINQAGIDLGTDRVLTALNKRKIVILHQKHSQGEM